VRRLVFHSLLTVAPMVTGAIGALLQPGQGRQRYRTRWRLFRVCGASRWQTALWVLQ
jgi:hypothetical protein